MTNTINPKFFIIVLASLSFAINVQAQQSIENILLEIEQNNTTLETWRLQTDADRLGFQTGFFLKNPEIEVGYFNGSPSDIGMRTTLHLGQNIDFPTTYFHRKQLATMQSQQSVTALDIQKRDLMHEARLLCLDLIYANALNIELQTRLGHAIQIENAYKALYEKGETNILEYNKARLNLLSTQKEFDDNHLEQMFLLGELQRLNGGKPLEFNDYHYPIITLPDHLDNWQQHSLDANIILQWTTMKTAISMRQASLSRAQTLPVFKIGYASESLEKENFRGIILGMTIPLWENKNTVKQAQAQVLANQTLAQDYQSQWINLSRNLFQRAQSLQKSIMEYKQILNTLHTAPLLNMALEKGEISLIEYIMELSVYYDTFNKTLESERELHKTLAELNKYL